MAHLAILEHDSRSAARLGAALGLEHAVRGVDSWSALEALLATDVVDACVVDMDHPGRDEATAGIRRIRKRHPGMAIVAHVELADRRSEVFEFGQLGVHGVLPTRDHRAPEGARTIVARAIAVARAANVVRWLDGRFGRDSARAIVWTVEHALDQPSVDHFARAVGRSPRKLGADLRAAGLPAPGRLLIWGRLLLAGAYLGRDGHTVEETAFKLGYSTGTALTRAMRRETGMTPSSIARRGGMSAVFAALFPRGGGRSGPRAVGLALLVGAASASCATATPPGSGPTTAVDPDPVSTILDAPPMDQVSFGVLAVDARTGDTLYARNAHRKFIPASNEKLLVTSAALSLLGRNYRYETAAWTVAAPVDGQVAGDLTVVGGGDPTLSARYWPDVDAALDALADSVRSAGIDWIRGDLVVDVSAWDTATVGPTWELGDLPWTYAATGGAFAVGEGELHVVVRGGMHEGDPVAVAWSPFGTDDFVDVRLTTAPVDSSTRGRPSYLPESRRVMLTGVVEQGATDTLEYAVRDPVRQAAAALHRAFRRRGIAVDGQVRIAWTAGDHALGACPAGGVTNCPGARRVAALRSPPMSDIVQGILEPSQNWMTEQLVRTLGAERGDGGTWPDGLDVIHAFLHDDVGVDSLDVSSRDGSGLSFYNLVTPRALVAVLRHMAAGPDADVYRHALAEPGEEGSTLSNRLEGLEGRVYAKTGTISNVNSLSGYLVGRNGREVVFSILSNGSGLPSSTVRATLDRVVRALAER